MQNNQISGIIQDVPSHGLKKTIFCFPEIHRSNAQSNQKCPIFQDDVLVHGTNKQEFDNGMLYVKILVHAKYERAKT